MAGLLLLLIASTTAPIMASVWSANVFAERAGGDMIARLRMASVQTTALHMGFALRKCACAIMDGLERVVRELTQGCNGSVRCTVGNVEFALMVFADVQMGIVEMIVPC